VLDQVVASLGATAERAGVTLRVDCAPSFTVPLRQRMLQVVAENLADNAIRYAGPRATLTLRARPGVFEAEDDGPGVDEAEVARLFERFYRADRARASRGTGLGLAIVKHVMTAAGGQVEASTNPGLRVTCSFPPS
jgi:signal transduction histidine kinase